jgi:hypothetical protein
LGERCYAVIEANFLGDLAVLNPEDRRAGEVHLSAGSRGQRPGQKITECRTGVRAATFPLTDDIVALCNQVGRAPEVEVRERPAEVLWNALMSSRPRRGSWSEYFSSISGAASSSTMSRLQVLPQKSVNHRPTMALFSSSLLIRMSFLAASERH